jgi:hypothetical protein
LQWFTAIHRASSLPSNLAVDSAAGLLDIGELRIKP